jgi:hypothetical protein
MQARCGAQARQRAASTEGAARNIMLQVKRQDQITFIHSEKLDRIPGIVHGFSSRRGIRNDFSLGPANSPDPMVQINRAQFLAVLGAPGWPIIKLRQVHSGTVMPLLRQFEGSCWAS